MAVDLKIENLLLEHIKTGKILILLRIKMVVISKVDEAVKAG